MRGCVLGVSPVTPWIGGFDPGPPARAEGHRDLSAKTGFSTQSTPAGGVYSGMDGGLTERLADVVQSAR